MNNAFVKLVIFAAGAAIGSAVTWKLVKTKYERIAQEEIDSVKEVYSRLKHGEETDKGLTVGITKEKPDIREYAAKLAEGGYTDYSDKKVVKEEVDDVEKPYVIPPEEFGELDYDIISLNYYEDGVLADDDNYIVDDLDSTVGADALSHFGEYDDDAVYVRNDRLKVDYEILMCLRSYSEICPDPTEDE